MEKPHDMTTLTEILEKFRQKGYDNELKMEGTEKMKCVTTEKEYYPEDLTLIKTYRFEGISDPADSTVVYLFEDADGDKSYVMDIYGAETDHDEEGFVEFLKSVPVKEKEHEIIFGKDK